MAVSKEGMLGTNPSFVLLKAALKRPTKTLEIKFTQSFSPDSLGELESLLTWVADKVEVDTVLLRSCGFWHRSPRSWASFSREDLEVLFTRLRKLVVGMFYLPQTIVMDLAGEVCDWGAELTLGADLRVAHEDLQLSWDMLERGRAPLAGGTSLLPSVVGEGVARRWFLGGEKLSALELLRHGFLSFCYRDHGEIDSLLKKISKQAPVARIQTKRALLEHKAKDLERLEKIDQSISRASLLTEDYRRGLEDFCAARHLTGIMSNLQ